MSEYFSTAVLVWESDFQSDFQLKYYTGLSCVQIHVFTGLRVVKQLSRLLGRHNAEEIVDRYMTEF